MTSTENANVTRKTAALVAGLSIFLMAILAGFPDGYVFAELVQPGNATATMSNLSHSPGLFRAGVFSWLLIAVCDILAAWALYVIFKNINTGLALLSTWFRLVYAAILGAGLLNFVVVLLLIHGDQEYLKMLPPSLMSAQVLLFLNAFDKFFSISLVVFGFHLVILSYLVYRSLYIPRFIAILLFVAALGYILTNSASLLFEGYQPYKEVIEMIFSIPMVLGELGLGGWLLFKAKTI